MSGAARRQRSRWPWRGSSPRSARTATVLLVALGAIALFGDLLASDLPLLLAFRGELYVLPAIVRPAALRGYDNQRLRRELGDDDWVVMPLCEYGPTQQPKIEEPPPAPPDGRHWLGTDDRGRDVFARLVHGTRVSLAVGFGSVALYLLFGAAAGLAAGYQRGWVDLVVSRLIEIGLTFPTFFLILTVMALLDGGSLLLMVVVIAVGRWADVARLVRAEALRLRELDFVRAAQLTGASAPRIIWRHLLPNASAVLAVAGAFGVGGAVLTETALSFLGFGVVPPTPSWGELLGQAYDNPQCWWLVVFPGLMIFTAVFATSMLGEAFRENLHGDGRSASRRASGRGL